jgi:hypothetical protein
MKWYTKFKNVLPVFTCFSVVSQPIVGAMVHVQAKHIDRKIMLRALSKYGLHVLLPQSIMFRWKSAKCATLMYNGNGLRSPGFEPGL